jgi:predicted DNA-binding protein YlxM (UPF0122 family)
VKNIQGKFYPMQHEEWIQMYTNLTKSQIGVLIYIRAIDPSGSVTDIKASEIADFLKISRNAVYEAIAVLVEKNFLPESFKSNFVSKNNIETTIRNRMKEELGGAIEVIIPVGRIDLLTDTEIIEIKEINDWKEALGQVLAYSSFFPQHSKRIHLFGCLNSSKLATARATVTEFDITVTFEEA